MPEADYSWLPRKDILQFEEIVRLLDVFLDLGVTKVRLTGGEPLLRRSLPRLVDMIASRPRVEDLAMTTNGLLLTRQAEDLRAAGLHRLTVSLDTLRRDRFRDLTRHDGLARVLDGIDVAGSHFPELKIDSVVIRGVNDDELVDLIEFGRRVGAEVRFIEYMDVGGATKWSASDVVSQAEILDHLKARYGAPTPKTGDVSAPATRYTLPDGNVFGIISSTTEPFCEACDRSRLTADGIWLLCLYAAQGSDLRQALRAGATNEEITDRVRATWSARADAGAEARLADQSRAALISLDALRRNPHLEMHTRGG
jgi:cyclic pyranopterin phosphate synthase